ncbi:hypothetical protein [Niastella sp. OAS944]|uniref:hypothetical protein n=1 Tax=Niastella sp. OAS944 TaxID=2664089 RepID=UPI003479D1E9|nr:hypothetical protein [Chitinophagaceae bacterium OAS944]
MKKSLLVVAIFIFVAVLLFFIAREIDECIYLRFAPEGDIIPLINYGIRLRLTVYGFYTLLLVILSLGGLLLSKRKKAIEYKKGFLLVSILSGLLFLTSLTAILVAVFW